MYLSHALERELCVRFAASWRFTLHALRKTRKERLVRDLRW